MEEKKKQRKINLTFRNNEKEIELYEWIKSKGDFVGMAGAIKQILNKAMEEEKRGEK